MCRINMRVLLLFFGFCFSVIADTYKCQDVKGVTKYQNFPCEIPKNIPSEPSSKQSSGVKYFDYKSKTAEPKYEPPKLKSDASLMDRVLAGDEEASNQYIKMLNSPGFKKKYFPESYIPSPEEQEQQRIAEAIEQQNRLIQQQNMNQQDLLFEQRRQSRLMDESNNINRDFLWEQQRSRNVNH